MNKNREICERLGIHWHEWVRDTNWMTVCKYCGTYQYPNGFNPDFTTDAGRVQLLRELEKHSWFEDFQLFRQSGSDWLFRTDIHTGASYLRNDLITEPDLLIDAVFEFLRKK